MRKTPNSPGEKIVKDIKRATRKHYSTEEKIRIVLDGLRGEDSIAELCRREGIAQGIYYKWSKDFKEALSIGSEIRLRGFTTFVAGGKMQCYSACALIWIAGVRRYMMPDASIGVHAAELV